VWFASADLAELMNSRFLVDTIVRQTMVLIAQVATTEGVRTPLAHIAGQIFMDLTQALEQQGVGRKVVADMFGLALRSYQQKVERLSESESSGGVTLWEAVHRYLTDQQVVSRADLMQRFSRDNPTSVAGVVHDMVESGLLYKTGRGDAVIYRIASAADVERALSDHPRTHEALTWLTIYREGPATRSALLERLPLPPAQIDRALAALMADRRVEQTDQGGEPRYSSHHIMLPLGESAGWEAGLIDHHRAMIAAMCAKLRNGRTRALPDDQVGGSTFSFDIWPGHPLEQRVLSLLATHRQQLGALWDEIAAHAARVSAPPDPTRVTFYVGQLVTADRVEQAEDDKES
jgi:hypothetical protein